MNNKYIFYLDKEYKNLLRKICSSRLLSFKDIPIEWEDLYWDFLHHFTTNLEFNPLKNKTFVQFISTECKYFINNKIRKYLSGKYKVLNNYIGDDVVSEYIAKNEPTEELKDFIRVAIEQIHFSELEKIIIRQNIMQDIPLKILSENLNYNPSAMSRTKQKIRSKFITFITNN